LSEENQLSLKNQAESMADNIVKRYEELQTPQEKADLYLICKEIQAVFKKVSAVIERRYCEEHKGERFEIGNNLFCVGNRKTNRFATADIYKVLDFTEAQIGVLPANPTFRKTAVKALEEVAKKELHWEDVQDKIELKVIPKHLLK